MIGFKTTSGSIYEVDCKAKRIRRLGGMVAPQPRQGPDGEWKPYESITDVEVGARVVITWDPATDPLKEGSPATSKPGTITAPVTRTWASTAASARTETQA